MDMDWLDPAKWKILADLIEHWKTIAGGTVVILGALGTMLGWFAKPIRWLIAKFRRTPSADAKGDRPLRFVAEDRAMVCNALGPDGKMGTVMRGMWHVTNVADKSIILLKVRLDKLDAEWTSVGTKHYRGDAFGNYPLLPGKISNVDANFAYRPPVHTRDEDFIADVIFTDNYGEEHTLRSVRFHY